MGKATVTSSQQETLAQRAKEINRQIWLAGLGAISKAEVQGRKGLDRCVSAGERVIGSDATLKSRYLVAARGLVATLREESEDMLNRLVDAGKKQQQNDDAEDNNMYVLAMIGAVVTLRDESQKMFSDLVASGEKRQNPQV